MSTALESFTDWIRATDTHAFYHVPLLERAEEMLQAGARVPQEERRKMAVALERWRYQRLNTRKVAAAAQDQQLIEALDETANALAGRAPRPARNPRAALQDTNPTAAELAVVGCLDERLPLDDLARQATALTQQHFGIVEPGQSPAVRRRMLMYAPLYLSSYCINHCTYCGFSFPLSIPRKHLTLDEALRQANILCGCGFRHILLVAGDFPSMTTTAYFVSVLRALSDQGISPSIEIAPQCTDSYAEMVAAGARGITLYQETFDEEVYAKIHLRGTKTSFDWRLEALERAAEAGMPRLGLGVLLGLAEPRADFLALVRYAAYLQSRFPDRTLAFSLPRIHEGPAGYQIPHKVDEATFFRMYCALRVAFPKAELVLSTREAAELRDRLARVCITQISAGSSTTPGGYEVSKDEATGGEQFPISDHRSPAEVFGWLREEGLAPVWDCR